MGEKSLKTFLETSLIQRGMCFLMFPNFIFQQDGVGYLILDYTSSYFFQICKSLCGPSVDLHTIQSQLLKQFCLFGHHICDPPTSIGNRISPGEGEIYKE